MAEKMRTAGTGGAKVLPLLAAMLVAGCGDNATEPDNRAPQATGTIPARTVEVGGSESVDVAGYFSDPDGDALSYEADSSDEAVATVSTSGSVVTVMAVAKGTATVTVTASDPGGLSAEQSFAVTVPNRPPQALHSIPAAEPVVGETLSVDASEHFSDPDGDALSYEAHSSDEAVAAVSVSGSVVTVMAVAKGTATVTVTASDPEGLTAEQSFAVTVPNQAPVAVGSIPGLELVTADSAMVDASAYFSDPDGDALTFAAESADPAVAAVSISGSGVTVTGVAEGATAITVTANDPDGLSSADTLAVSVVLPVPSAVIVTPDTAVLTALDQSVQLEAAVLDQIGRPMTEVGVVWSSADTSVVTVDSTGLATAAGRGMTGVTASAGAVSGTARLSVMQTVSGVTVAPESGTLAPGDTLRLSASADDENGHPVEDAEFVWSSSDHGVADVDDSGLVRGIGEGAATITVAAGGASGASRIAVANPDRAVLIALYEATNGPNWANDDGWLTEGPLRNWYGVNTDGFGRVVGVNLAGRWDNEAGEWVSHGLEGPIPPGIGDLANLRWLELGQNDLTGPIPSQLGNLSSLESLYLSSNQLTGSIPTELGSLTALRYLSLGRNELTGPIPSQLGDLSSLESLYLSGNQLTGSLPTELGSLTALRYLSLGWNELTGPIPSQLGNLSSLESLHLSSNQLTGSIPTELGSLTALRYLSLGGNELTGPIPSELGNLSSLESLHLSGNQLTGSIPTELGSLTALRHLSLGGNGLTGSIPSQLGNLSSLESLYLSGNQLTGSVPSQLGNLSSLESLYLSGNQLTGPIPRSLLQLANLTDFFFERNDGLCAPGTAEFATWIEGMERSEGPFCNRADREALERLFETASGSGWAKSDGWLATPVLEEWHGVTADPLGRVTTLDLGGNGLSGSLPNKFGGQGTLAAMTELRIGGNAGLAGRLPLSLADLSLRELHYAGTGLCAPADADFAQWLNAIPYHEGTGAECAPLSDREILEALYDATGGPDWTNNENWLTGAPLGEWHGVRVDDRGRVVELSFVANRLRGQLPEELGGLTTLQSLALVRNYSGLTGPIPRALAKLTNLEGLYLFTNSLNGPIPPELGGLPNLRTLSLGDNRLEGSIPPELGGLPNLRWLFLSQNQLEGSVPAELGDLATLRHLSLEDNALTGPIPRALAKLANLRTLSLARNAMTGPLPSQLGGLAELAGLYLGHNDLSGPVPPEFGGLERLRELALSGNSDMSGTLPSSLTGLHSLETMLTGGTGLCAPADADFLEWLEGVPSRRVTLCGGEPASAYLVQPVQSREFPVPLVAGEEALLRVFVTAADANEEPLPAVRASFYLNGELAHVADIAGKAGPIPTDVDEGSLAKSSNGVIPGEVVRPGLEMVIEVDPGGTLDPGLGVTNRIPRTGRMSVDVREMPTLDLTLIPFLWSTDPDAAIVELTAAMAADPEGHELLEHTRMLLPVGELDVTAHEPVVTSSNDAYAMHAQTWAIRAMEGGGGHYMGMMSGPVTGAGGLGSVPGRITFSVPGSGVIAHELGHNMSLSHAPCGTAGDPAFPHFDGATGAWGYDFRDGGGLVGPEEKDLMSYCGPWWISDFHFTNALDFRLADEGDPNAALLAGATTSILLWGGVDSTGTPFLEPAFVVDAPPALPGSAGEHRITGRSASGGELFSLRFAMPEIADGDGSASFAFALPARPGWEADLAAITLSGPGGSVTLDGDSDFAMAILRNPLTGQVRGILRDVPDRAAGRAATMGAGPGLEVLFSRGIPDAEAWRR